LQVYNYIPQKLNSLQSQYLIDCSVDPVDRNQDVSFWLLQNGDPDVMTFVQPSTTAHWRTASKHQRLQLIPMAQKRLERGSLYNYVPQINRFRCIGKKNWIQ